MEKRSCHKKNWVNKKFQAEGTAVQRPWDVTLGIPKEALVLLEHCRLAGAWCGMKYEGQWEPYLRRTCGSLYWGLDFILRMGWGNLSGS